MSAYLERIRRVNPAFNAIVQLQPEEALLRQADQRDDELARGRSMGWMHGMPQAIKDIAPVAGMVTTLGALVLRDHVPAEDGLMVQRMRQAGSIFIGRTNSPEFGLGSHTYNQVYGITRNAWDLRKSAGGSSGGAAVALALRMLPVADGSDFMGSLRNPAGWNHVFGMRPSRGRVPLWPASDVWLAQLGTEGPMARTVEDLAQLLNTQSGPDPRTPLALEHKPDLRRLDGLEPRQVRLGWLGDLGGYLAMEEGVLTLCEQALTRFQALGCTVERAALGTPPEPVWQAWLVWRRALVATRIAPFLKADPANRAKIKPEALWEHDQAQRLGGNDLLEASTVRTAFFQHLLKLFERHDYLVLPTAQVWPFDAEEHWPNQIRGVAMDTYHRWMEVTIYATFAGLPCVAIPAGFGPHGLPMGLQIIGRPHDDLGVLRLARLWEQGAAELLARRPPD